MNIKHIFIFIMLVVSLSACGAQKDNAAATQEATPVVSTSGIRFVIGDVSEQVDETTRELQPLANYLQTQLAPYGVSQVTVRVAPNLETMGSWMAQGIVDLYMDSSYPTLFVDSLSDASPVLRQWLNGRGEYHSLFFTLNDSGIETLDDLRGHVVAFDKSFSTSGYFLPSTYLMQSGYSIERVDDANSIVDSDTIGYVFSMEDVNTVNWVIAGRVIAGVTNNIVYDSIPQETRDHFRIIEETNSMPQRLVSLSPMLESDLRDAVINILTNMNAADNESGQQALLAINTTLFDEMPEGAEAFNTRMDTLLSILRGQEG